MLKTSQGKGDAPQARIYLDEYCLIECGFSEKTILNKTEALGRYFDFLKGEEITLDSCRKYTKCLFDKGWQNSSIRAELKTLKAYLHYLYKLRVLNHNWSYQILLTCSDSTINFFFYKVILKESTLTCLKYFLYFELLSFFKMRGLKDFSLGVGLIP